VYCKRFRCVTPNTARRSFGNVNALSRQGVGSTDRILLVALLIAEDEAGGDEDEADEAGVLACAKSVPPLEHSCCLPRSQPEQSAEPPRQARPQEQEQQRPVGAMAAKSIKCVVVGDGAVGKTCMLVAYAEDRFPEEYLPTVFDNYAAQMVVDGNPICLELWDTAGQEDYDRVRPLSYPNTDVFLVAFSVTSRTSFTNVRDKWLPELLSQPLVDLSVSKVILVGTKSDLRGDAAAAAATGGDLVSREEGEALAKQLACVRYLECSARTREGLKQVRNRTAGLFSTRSVQAPHRDSG
jgi:small GTP-binding protein